MTDTICVDDLYALCCAGYLIISCMVHDSLARFLSRLLFDFGRIYVRRQVRMIRL